jgi:hypothetical protein
MIGTSRNGGFMSQLSAQFNGMRLITGAWLVQAVAWFLPVVKDGVRLPEGLPGWQAFRVAAAMSWPGSNSHYGAWNVLAGISALTTVLFILGSPWVMCCGSRSLRRFCAWTFSAAFVVNTHWYFSEMRPDLRIGYFLWWFSFLPLGIGLLALVGKSSRDAAA